MNWIGLFWLIYHMRGLLRRLELRIRLVVMELLINILHFIQILGRILYPTNIDCVFVQIHQIE
jgi:hypothetical protein